MKNYPKCSITKQKKLKDFENNLQKKHKKIKK